MIRAAGIAIALALAFGAASWHSSRAQDADRYPHLERSTVKTERTVKRSRYVKRTVKRAKYAKKYRAAKRKRSARRHGGKVSRPAVSSTIVPVVVPTIATVPAPLVGGLPPDFAEMPNDIIVTVANRFDHAFGALAPAPVMPPPIRQRARKWPSLTNHGIAGEAVIVFALAGFALAAIALLVASIRQDNQAAMGKERL